MKFNYSFLLIFLCLFFSQIVISQSYDRMVIEGNRWDGAVHIGMGVNFPATKVICQKQVIDNIEYHVVNYFYADETYSELEEASINNFYIREDTIEKKVFLKYEGEEEFLFADFGVEVGDSILRYNKYLKVGAYGIENIFGKERRVQYLYYNEFTNDTPFSFVEGYGIWPSGVFEATADYWAHDFFNDPMTCNTTDVEEVGKLDTKIFPNPAHEFLFLKPVEKYRGLEFKILNVTGQKVSQGYIDDGGKINVSELSSGIHFFMTEKGVQKFIKL